MHTSFPPCKISLVSVHHTVFDVPRNGRACCNDAQISVLYFRTSAKWSHLKLNIEDKIILPNTHLGIWYFLSRYQAYPLHSRGHSCNCICSCQQVLRQGLSKQNMGLRNCTWIGSLHNSLHFQIAPLSFPGRIFLRLHSKVAKW